MKAKQFIETLDQGNEILFQACENQVKAYFDAQPSKEELVDHFINRMVNERMNLIEISGTISRAESNTNPDELVLLAKQALDEAKHFKMVKSVVEHIIGGEFDLESAVNSQLGNEHSKGASLLAKYEGNQDELMLALYQYLAEGRAARNWAMMAECVDDTYVAQTYAKIARDEKFHSNIGRRKLVQLLENNENQERILAVVDEMRKDLYTINCLKCGVLEDSKKMVETAFGAL